MKFRGPLDEIGWTPHQDGRNKAERLSQDNSLPTPDLCVSKYPKRRISPLVVPQPNRIAKHGTETLRGTLGAAVVLPFFGLNGFLNDLVKNASAWVRPRVPSRFSQKNRFVDERP